jgi:hypothetical protein
MDVHFVHLHQVYLNVQVNVFQESYNMYQAMKPLFELVILANLDEAKRSSIKSNLILNNSSFIGNKYRFFLRTQLVNNANNLD